MKSFLEKYLNKKRKAISPLIATILLIVVAVSLIALIINWSRTFTDDNLSLTTIDLYTESDLSFYVKPLSSMNGRTILEFTPPHNFNKSNFTVIGYGVLGLTEHIVPLDPPITLNSFQLESLDHGIILPEFDLILYLDNDTMIIKNIKQEIKFPRNCPDGYVSVPGNFLYDTMNSDGGFCVMKWEAKTDANLTIQQACRHTSGLSDNNYYQWHHLKSDAGYDCNVGSYNIVSTAENYPITMIRQNHSSEFDAIDACLSTGGQLLTNDHWMTIVRNIELVPENWSGGEIGEGYLPRGNSNSLTSWESRVLDGFDELSGVNKRTLTLTNGEVIWDLAGNVWQWTSDIIHPDNKPLSFSSDGSPENSDNWYAYTPGDSVVSGRYILWNNLGEQSSLGYKDLFLLTSGSYGANEGIGRIYLRKSQTTNRAFLRGGNWNNGTNAGVLNLYLSSASSNSNYYLGLRCFK